MRGRANVERVSTPHAPSPRPSPGGRGGKTKSPRPARLQTRLHVPARLRRDGDAVRHVVTLRPDHLQVNRTLVAAFVQHPDVPEQVDVAAAVRLELRRAGVLLSALAVADVD